MKINLIIEKDDFYALIVPLAEKLVWTHPKFYDEVKRIKETLKEYRTRKGV